jgi:uncharacterized UBP type Zn finger protein
MSTAVCSHLDTIEFTAIPDPVVGCEECLKIGSTWVHLRMCMECGKIGCCDDSPNGHASKHAREVSHPIIKSAEAARTGAGATSTRWRSSSDPEGAWPQ